MTSLRGKGQISFDLIFAIIALGVFLYFLVVFVDDFSVQQNKINIRNQEGEIALLVKSAINACQIADAGPANNDTEVRITLPKINEIGASQTAARCQVSVPFQGSRHVGVNYTMANGETVSTSIPVGEWGGSFLHNCGDILTINC
jgi:hypothetical protein